MRHGYTIPPAQLGSQSASRSAQTGRYAALSCMHTEAQSVAEK